MKGGSGYTSGRCIYCGKPLYQKRGGHSDKLRRSAGIACARHNYLLKVDPGVPRWNAT